ncbi:DUF1080 domain-containing protein [Alteromonas sp. H39]|uniref:3-keto-disaccharide hydrolase n=1 Tax=Alteromonas sp. H39 TaxID=3389876 RepID=UPI0039E0F03D
MKFAIAALTLVFASQACAKEEWQYLLDDGLTHWDTYISFKHKDSYDGSAPLNADGSKMQPVGLNTGNEELQVFNMMRGQNNEPVLHISGEYYGGVSTKKAYKNYHFTLQFKWGDKKWEPRLNKLKDSGILYHAFGEHGKDYYRSWLLSQEFQIMQGHVGDYWNQMSTAIDVRAFLPEYIMNPIADETQPFLAVGKDTDVKGLVLRKENHEKPHGQWNTLDLIAFEDKSLHIVNGEVVMVLRHSRNVVNGKPEPLTKGKIQLQSEAAEIFYKGIAIKQLDQMPARYAHYFDE